ncbi:hypothetical protein HNO53_02995 [Billgrantia antri]|uniref:OmpA-like domain-containing protein n=1 Tax=Halomonas sulfidivorans TaxID=2733488 RepID=A0ABX7WE57_9GAMM|nr:hypothetical protein [Halomonas sulfidivorans]QTP57782.1 hypothetical protein HNO53_02995 [Halomonas sulfidivorans]
MSDPVIITLFIRGALAFIITVGGVYCIYQGCRLLFGKNHSISKSTFDATIAGHSISFTAGAAGTAVVFTSILWLGGAVYVVPGLDLADGTRVAFLDHSKNKDNRTLAALRFKDFEGEELSKTQSEILSSFLSQAHLSLSEPSIVLEAFPASGASEVEAALADRRANLLRERLISEYDFEPSKIQVMSYGESKPVSFPTGEGEDSGGIIINILSAETDGP